MKLLTKVLLFAYTLLSSICANAYDFEVDGIYYDIVSLTDFTCGVTKQETGYYTGDITIPSTVKYNNREVSVISIEDDAFRKCSSLTSIKIPNSVTSIGLSAFRFVR